jgi:hypothetical protein
MKSRKKVLPIVWVTRPTVEQEKEMVKVLLKRVLARRETKQS